MKQLLLCTTVALLFLAGCTDSGADSDKDTPEGTEGVVLTESDYVTGWVGFVDSTSYAQGIVIDSDARISVGGGSVYVLERTLSNIMKLDASGQPLYQQKLADEYNPQAMAYVSESRAYIAGLGSQWLYEINPSNGMKTDSIDLSGFNNGENTVPEAKDLALVAGYLYVGMSRFDANYVLNAPSKVAVIDIASNTIADTIALEGYNFTLFAVDNDEMYVLCSGDSYGTKEHGTIEKIDGATNTVVTLGNNLLNGAPITSMTQRSGTEFYVGAYKGWGDMPVSLIDVVSGAEITTVPSVVNAFGGMAYEAGTGILYIGENGEDFGLALYDENVGTTSLIETTLKPSSVTLK